MKYRGIASVQCRAEMISGKIETHVAASRVPNALGQLSFDSTVFRGSSTPASANGIVPSGKFDGHNQEDGIENDIVFPSA